LRTLLLITAVVAVLLWLVSKPLFVGLGCGHVNVPLDFMVIDADSKQPIAGASILLQDADHRGSPPEPPYTMLITTGPDGHATFVLRHAMVDSGWNAITGRRLYRRVGYPLWEMQVSASGYQDFRVSYEEFWTSFLKDRRFHEDAVPPPIV